jgi:predicted small lipoprotein YifL
MALALLTAACGKKGPPLPPLVKLPVAPADVVAARRGNTVDLQLTVPATNTDSSRPANVAHVDVYAFTGLRTVTDAVVLAHGTRVASVEVKAPRDPEATTDPDDPADDENSSVEPPEGRGLDQGAVAHVQETLTEAARMETRVVGKHAPPMPPADDGASGPLLGPSRTTMARIYVGVGVTARNRRGPSARRVVVPLTTPPAPPGAPKVTYTETAITVAWPPAPSAVPVQEPAVGRVLPATLLMMSTPRLAYHVYETPPPVVAAAADAKAPGAGPAAAVSLTRTPIVDTSYSDTRMVWGATRCYAVRTVEIADALAVESGESAPACVTLVDTFPPAAPKGLQAVASGEGAINLIWDANTEADLGGYIVLRGIAPGPPRTRLTPTPITDASFRDTGEPGVRYVYAVVAVDKAGNVSQSSDHQEETAR